jgi:acetylornithine aminotransferase/acetylornithine/N-succinyldiaminopimelate aminotransferase
MKEFFAPSAVVQNQHASVRALYDQFVMPTYGRFDIVFDRGEGNYLFDVNNRRYLDLGAGIAVCCLGHARPEITQVLVEQSAKLLHVSNLYYTEPQARLAQAIVKLLAPGRVFFCNSGAEANEGLFKLARRFGHDKGRHEIITATNSFHGRTLAGIAATGQEKVKAGFGPAVEGFRHVPFNDLAAARAAVTPKTAAILIEGVQGEGGITAATPDYLLGLRALCDEKGLLLLMDEVQCGHFRTGCFQSWQRILEGVEGGDSFLPDAVSMAKSLGGGFPIGAFWVREKHAGLLGPGSHGTTYGGTPLACAVALAVLEIIARDKLADNAREQGAWLQRQIGRLMAENPRVITAVRGRGLMLGFELAPKDELPALAGGDKPASLQFVNRLHELGVLTIPSGDRVVRLLPPLTLTRTQAGEGITAIERVVKSLG